MLCDRSVLRWRLASACVCPPAGQRFVNAHADAVCAAPCVLGTITTTTTDPADAACVVLHDTGIKCAVRRQRLQKRVTSL